MTNTGTNAAEVFRRFGLGATGFWQSVAVPPADDGIRPGAKPPSAKLTDAFEELGGVYPAFAQFLLWRADLLEAEYLTALRQLRCPVPPVPRDQVAALLRRELGSASDGLVREMEDQPVWSTFSRTAYLSWHKGAVTVVQVAREPVGSAALADFEAGIKYLGHPDICRVNTPQVLQEFRQWLRHGESSVLERSYLDVLARNKGATLVDYPALIEEITTDNVLCWPWIEGETVGSLIGRGSVDSVGQVAAAVLEQYCSLSIIDTDLHPDAMVLPTGASRLAVRRINRPLPVPPPSVNIGMKYIAAVLEGNASMIVQTLLSMAVGQSSANLESDLLNLMSGIEPELKVRLWYPGSAAAFESNWRALAKLQVARPRPLYLDCLHRNLIALGYWTGEAVSNGGRQADTIAEAQLPVLGRMLQSNASQFLNANVLTEWSVGLGLLTFGAMREANRLAEEVRENNLTMGVEPAVSNPRPRTASWSLRTVMLAACLLVTLLTSLRWGSTALMHVVAVGALIGLFWVVAKIS